MKDEYRVEIAELQFFNNDMIALKETVGFVRGEQEFILVVKEADR